MNEGDGLPPFRLPDGGGKEWTAADFEGKWRVLFFYSKDNTSG
jgi:peroxiredoxin